MCTVRGKVVLCFEEMKLSLLLLSTLFHAIENRILNIDILEEAP